MRQHWEITEEFFGYDPDEYDRWVSAEQDVSRVAVASRIAVCGTLGRSGETFTNQARRGKGGQNFSEVVYACHLAALGFPPDGLIYENYSFSMKDLDEQIGQRISINVAKLKEVLDARFFLGFDTLCDRNPAHVGKRTRARMIVDLLAIDPVKRKLGIYEVKKYPPRGQKTEPFQAHQQFTLAAVNHIFATLGAEAFVGAPWAVEIKLIAFAAAQDLRLARITPASYSIDFSS